MTKSVLRVALLEGMAAFNSKRYEETEGEMIKEDRSIGIRLGPVGNLMVTEDNNTGLCPGSWETRFVTFHSEYCHGWEHFAGKKSELCRSDNGEGVLCKEEGIIFFLVRF